MTRLSSTPIRDFHTLTEILSQPEVWRSCLGKLKDHAGFSDIRAKMRAHKTWLFTGCGTSFYLAEAAAACVPSLKEDSQICSSGFRPAQLTGPSARSRGAD